MYLQFVAKSHLFFTAGKDNKIKQWDADKFEHIQTLEVGSFGGSWNEALSLCEQHFPQELGDVLFVSYLFSLLQGHHQEVWCLALSPNGDYVVSASHDKSLRLWERTREPLILEEEREMVSCVLPPKDSSQISFWPIRQVPHFSLWQSLAPRLVGFLITNHSLVLRCLGWLPSSAWLHCCLKLSGDSTTGIACALLLILHCRCLANLLSILCFCPTSQTSMVVVLLAIVNKLLLLSCAHFYWSVLGTVQQVAVVGWWRAPFLLNAACFLFPLSKHE